MQKRWRIVPRLLALPALAAAALWTSCAGGAGTDSAVTAAGAEQLRTGDPDALSAQPVNIVDVAVTALAHLGIPIDPAWRLDGKPVGLAR